MDRLRDFSKWMLLPLFAGAGEAYWHGRILAAPMHRRSIPIKKRFGSSAANFFQAPIRLAAFKLPVLPAVAIFFDLSAQ